MPDREISSPPRITIGITAYNAEETIALAVNSALGQTWSDTEIVVVDDCSTDGTADVLSELAKSFDDLRIVRHAENRGVGAARNTILEHATGFLLQPRFVVAELFLEFLDLRRELAHPLLHADHIDLALFRDGVQ